MTSNNRNPYPLAQDQQLSTRLKNVGYSTKHVNSTLTLPVFVVQLLENVVHKAFHSFQAIFICWHLVTLLLTWTRNTFLQPEIGLLRCCLVANKERLCWQLRPVMLADRMITFLVRGLLEDFWDTSLVQGLNDTCLGTSGLLATTLRLVTMQFALVKALLFRRV